MTRRLTPAASLTAATLAALLALAGCAPSPTGGENGSSSRDTVGAAASQCEGVRLVVEFSELKAETLDTCVETTAAVGAREVLDAAGITTEGTLAYGDATVCRVNGRPSSDEVVTVDGYGELTETCESFTEGMYWALWHQDREGEWVYAPVGVNELVLEPGGALGLVFTTGDGSTELPPKA